MSADDIKLPPLPGPDHHESKTNRKLYIPDQMQCYARAAIQADRASRAPSPQGDAGWMLIEEDAPIDVPLDTAVLLAWWDDWSEEWRIEANYAGSKRGGWRHGRATHWMPLPAPPAARGARSTPAKGGE